MECGGRRHAGAEARRKHGHVWSVRDGRVLAWNFYDFDRVRRPSPEEKGLTDTDWAAQVMAHVDGTAQSVAAAKQLTDALADLAVTADPHPLLPIVGIQPDAP